MKILNSFLLMLFLVLTAFNLSAQNDVVHKVLSPKEFVAAYNAEKDAVLLDVRTSGELKKVGYLKGSVNLNIFEEDFKQQLEKLDKTKPVYVYCHSGGRSDEAAQMMKKMGFVSITDMRGGMAELIKSGIDYQKPASK
jgi:rhodanese-related sulfurtransferase